MKVVDKYTMVAKIMVPDNSIGTNHIAPPKVSEPRIKKLVISFFKRRLRLFIVPSDKICILQNKLIVNVKKVI